MNMNCSAYITPQIENVKGVGPTRVPLVKMFVLFGFVSPRHTGFANTEVSFDIIHAKEVKIGSIIHL